MKKLLMPLIFLFVSLPCAQPAFAVDIKATVEWSEKYIVQFAVDGLIKEVNVEQGSVFEKGQMLISIDSTAYKQQVNRLNAKKSGLKSLFDVADRELNEANVLYEQTVLSDTELHKVKVSYDVAKSDLEQTEALLRIAQWELQHASIIAPWAGFVLEKHVLPGRVVTEESKDTPLLVLARTDKLKVLGWVSKSIAKSVQQLTSVAVKVGGKAYSGVVKQLHLNMHDSAHKGEYRLTVEFDSDPLRSVKAGQAAVIKLP